VGAVLTYCRGASIHGRVPLFFNKWLLRVNADEPSWRPERGWLVAWIGIWPGDVVWLLVNDRTPLIPFSEWWVPIAAAALTWLGSCAAFTLGHARFQDGGTWSPPPDYVPEDTYLHDALGMAWTGGAMSLVGAGALALYGLWIPAALMLAGGVAKAAAYMIGWTKIAERVIGPYWLPTRAAEVVQGLFLYGGFSAALLIGRIW